MHGRLLGALGLLWLILFAGSLHAEQPPDPEPQLRIEAGMHTGAIIRMGVSADGRLMVTASHDKTVRLWSLPDGKLLKVLRAPIGPANDGKMHAVAITPDGRYVAAGGWDAYAGRNGMGQNFVFLFDTISGNVVKRLGPLPNVIMDLAFSRDGARLAVGLGITNGIRVYSAPFVAAPLEDRAYNSDVYGLSFDQAGNLAAASFDGWVRLYDQNLHLYAKQKMLGGTQPFGVAYSPDGKTLAVGFNDTTQINIVSAQNLQLLYSADTAQLQGGGNLGTLAWSVDGQTLYAGGRARVGTVSPVFAIDNQGRGSVRVLGGATDTVMDLAALPDGGVAFASFDPAFGLFDKTGKAVPFHDDKGKEQAYKVSPKADMRGKVFNTLGISPDGTGVWFGFGYGATNPALFDANRLTMEPNAPPPSTYLVANTTLLKIDNWLDAYSTALNGKLLPLDLDEFSRSLAIAPDAKSFLLATEWSVHRFDVNGNRIWRRNAGTVTWAVDLAANGAIALVAQADGTLRWLRASDGAELLALFVDVPTKRWIAWTPSGYYAASPGGEDLIGWHVNGKSWDDPVQFYPASLFRDRFYRPDVVQLVLKTLDEPRAVQQANDNAKRKPEQEGIGQALPPVVEIIADPRGTEASTQDLPIKYKLRSPSGKPITKLEVRIDGQLTTARGVAEVDQDLDVDKDESVTANIPPRDCIVSLIAYIGDQPSEAASITIKWKGNVVVAPKPRLYALLVGVSEYDDKNLKLNFAAKDANDLAAALKRQEGKYFSSVDTVVLTDHVASEDEIQVELARLKKRVGPNDYAVVFMAGHGMTDAQGGFHFLPANANIADDELDATSLDGIVIRNSLRTIRGKVLLFMDACNAGQGIAGGESMADMTGFANDLSRESNGVVMYASSTGRQFSYENTQWQNGAFTRALIETLGDPEAFGKDKLLSISELDEQLTQRVESMTDNRQTPVMTKPGAIPRFFLAAM